MISGIYVRLVHGREFVSHEYPILHLLYYYTANLNNDGSSVRAVLRLLGDVGTGTDKLLVWEYCVCAAEYLVLPLLAPEI